MLKLQNLLTTSKYAFVLQMLITTVIFVAISALYFFGSFGNYGSADTLPICCAIQPIAVVASIALKKRNRAISTGLLIAVILWDVVFPSVILIYTIYLCQTGSCPTS